MSILVLIPKRRCNYSNPEEALTANDDLSGVLDAVVHYYILLYISYIKLSKIWKKLRWPSSLRENSRLLEQPKEIGVISDGVKILNELPSVAAVMAMLLGCCYNLNWYIHRGSQGLQQAEPKDSQTE